MRLTALKHYIHDLSGYFFHTKNLALKNLKRIPPKTPKHEENLKFVVEINVVDNVTAI